LAARLNPIQGHLLIGHTHWNHIPGFPFFAPLFNPNNTWDIYAPGDRGRQIEACLAGQMAYEYFLITLEALHADVQLHELKEGVFDLGSIRVTTQYLNHPALTLGYRLEADGATLVYATDHEPYSLYPQEALPGEPPIHHEDRRHIRFLEGADLVIHDAQYSLDDFPAKAGWGHAPMERVVDYAMLAGVTQLALFHHDPDRDDEAVERLAERAQTRADAGCESLPDIRLHDLPIVILTGGKLKEADVIEAFAAGATDYLTKPIKPTLIRSRVRTWLSRISMTSPVTT
jgi:ribonuclease BN (tRNA processing enzyme)